MKLVKLILKNFQIVLRSKVSSLIILLGPLLVMLLAGYAFNNESSFDLTVGVFVSEDTALTSQFLDALNEQFTIVSYDDSVPCVDGVQNLQLHACIQFPENFALENNRQNIIDIYVDNSKVNIVEIIQGTLNNVIRVESSEISSDLTTVLVTSISDVSSTLQKWEEESVGGLISSENDFSTTLTSDKDALLGRDLSYEGADDVMDSLDDEVDVVGQSLLGLQQNGLELVEEIEKLADSASSANASSSVVSAAREKAESIEASLLAAQGITGLLDAVDEAKDSIENLQDVISSAQGMKREFGKKYDSYMKTTNDILVRMNTLQSEIVSLNDKLKSIQITDTQSIISPVSSKINPVVTGGSRLQYIFPSLMVLVIMFVSLMLSATLVLYEKKSPAKFRLFTTPTSDISFVLSIFFTTLIVSLVQIILLLLVAHYLFSIGIVANLFMTVMLLLVGAIVFTLIGMIIGYLFSNEQTTILAAISVGSAFILVSDIILPLETMPIHLQQIISYTPFLLLSNLLRKSILFDATLAELGLELAIIWVYAVALFLIIVVTYKIVKMLFLWKNVHKGKRDRK